MRGSRYGLIEDALASLLVRNTAPDRLMPDYSQQQTGLTLTPHHYAPKGLVGFAGFGVGFSLLP